jgi:hypothetical protein
MDALRQGVQNHAAMAVDDALGVSRPGGREADGRRAALVELWELEPAIGIGDRPLVGMDGHAPKRSHRRRRAAEDDDRPHRREIREELLDQPELILVNEQHVVARPVDGESDVLGRKAQVGGMEYRAHARHAVVGLEMAPVNGSTTDTHNPANLFIYDP